MEWLNLEKYWRQKKKERKTFVAGNRFLLNLDGGHGAKEPFQASGLFVRPAGKRLLEQLTRLLPEGPDQAVVDKVLRDGLPREENTS
jgi:hypothetical protein